MASSIVIAPLVIATATDGSQVYLYRGAVVTTGLAAGEKKRLTDEGFIEPLPEVEETPVVVVTTPVDPPAPAVEEKAGPEKPVTPKQTAK